MKRGGYLARRTPLKAYTALKSAQGRTKRVKAHPSPKPRLWSLKKADDEFSLFIRKRDGKCKRCGKPRSPTNPLTCSHFWARQHKGTRFDVENCDALCWMPCHKYHFEKEKQGAYRDFKLKQLGPARYAAMEARARGVYPQVQAIMDCMRLLGALPE